MDEEARLIARRDALRLEISTIEQVLVRIHEARVAARKLLGEATTTSGEGATVSPQEVGQTDAGQTVTRHVTAGNARDTRRSVRKEVMEFEAVIRDILADAEHPMDRAELLDAVTLRGVHVGGKDPKNTLGARLTRMSGVENVPGQGYWLTGRNPRDSGGRSMTLDVDSAENDAESHAGTDLSSLLE